MRGKATQGRHPWYHSKYYYGRYSVGSGFICNAYASQQSRGQHNHKTRKMEKLETVEKSLSKTTVDSVH